MFGKRSFGLVAAITGVFMACAPRDPGEPGVTKCSALASDRDGAALAALYRDHVPTAGERSIAAVVWAALVVTAHGDAPPAALFASPGYAPLAHDLPALYPSALGACAATGTAQEAL